MPQIRVTLSANAGVSIEIGGKRVWVDALHREKQPGFSTVTEPLLQEVLHSKAFADPDCICFTHCHGDHYSRSLTEKARQLWPGAKCFLPEREFGDQILVTGRDYIWNEQDLTLRFLQLPHEGASYGDVSHYGLLVSTAGVNIFLSGDCAVASPEVDRALENIPIDLAILDFPWVALKKGREFLDRHLRPKHIILYHLPFGEDDLCGYRAAALRAAGLPECTRDVRLLMEPLQTETVNILGRAKLIYSP